MIALLKNIILFHRKTLPVALLVMVPLQGVLHLNFLHLFFSLLVLSLPIHYLEYERRHPQEYYYYHNVGLSKRQLWLSTVILSLLLAVILALL